MAKAIGDTMPAAGSRNGRSWSGSRLRNALSDNGAPAYIRTEALVISPTSDCHEGNGRKQMQPVMNAAISPIHGTPRALVHSKIDGHVAVAREAVGHAGGAGGVDDTGARRADDRVQVDDRGQPADADQGRDLGERAGEQRVVGGVARVGPGLADRAFGQRHDERHLQQDVDDRADQHRADDRERDVPLGVLGLTGQLVGLLEAEVAEDDAAGRDRLEHSLEPGRREAVWRRGSCSAGSSRTTAR